MLIVYWMYTNYTNLPGVALFDPDRLSIFPLQGHILGLKLEEQL